MKTPPFPFTLTRSKLRSDLLTLFFLNPGETYYLRELGRRLEASPGALSRELGSLSGEGLLKRLPRGKQVFYQINPEHPLFNEIKTIVEKTTGVPAAISEGLKAFKEIREAWLYGSVVTGKMDAHSDIDLLMVGKETDAVLKFLGKLEARFGRSVNSVIYAPKEFEKKRKEKSEFLYSMMKLPLIQVKPA